MRSSFLVLGATLLMPGVAVGDSGLQQASIPELAIYELLVGAGVDFSRTRGLNRLVHRYELRSGAGRSDAQSGALLGGRVGVAIGGRSGFLSVDSAVDTLWNREDEAGVRGSHRLLGLYYLGNDDGDLGAELSVDASLRHTKGLRFRLDAPRWGARLQRVGDASLGAILRHRIDDVVLAMPLRVGTTDAAYATGPLAQVTAHRARMGIGLAPRKRELVRGAIEFLRLSFEQQEYKYRDRPGEEAERVSAPSSERGLGLPALDKIRLGTAASELTMLDDDVRFTVSYFAGWAWLAEQKEAAVTRNGFEAHLGAQSEFVRQKSSLRLGWGASRELSRVAQTGEWVKEWRAELRSGFEKGPVSIESSASVSWLRSLGSSGAGIRSTRYGGRLAAYYSLSQGMAFGAFAEASREPAWTTERSSGLSHEAGVVLRWRKPSEPSRPERYECGYSLMNREPKLEPEEHPPAKAPTAPEHFTPPPPEPTAESAPVLEPEPEEPHEWRNPWLESEAEN